MAEQTFPKVKTFNGTDFDLLCVFPKGKKIEADRAATIKRLENNFVRTVIGKDGSRAIYTCEKEYILDGGRVRRV